MARQCLRPTAHHTDDLRVRSAPGLRAPLLDPDEAGLNQVRSREEPRHLLAAAVCVLLLAHSATVTKTPARRHHSKHEARGLNAYVA